jgi:hypothetical protein
MIEKTNKDLLEFYVEMPTVPAAARMTPLAQVIIILSSLSLSLSLS